MIRARLNPAPPPEILEKPVVGVLLPLPLAGAYDYKLPAGCNAGRGALVAAPLGNREMLGAVWGRAEMNVFLRTGLWLFANLVPGFTVTGQVAKVQASDNREAIKRLSNDPLTIHETRFDTVRGLVDLMDAALAAEPRFHARALFLYGGHDELIPEKATAATWHALPDGPVRAYYPAAYHLLLLAENLEGYKNLVKLSSIAYREGFYYKPRIDKEVLRQYPDNLDCLVNLLFIAQYPNQLLQCFFGGFQFF